MPSQPAIPNHELRDKFVGVWESDGDTAIVVERMGENEIHIRFPANPIWDGVVNNVRFIEDELHFDMYHYFTGSDDFSALGGSTGDHPFSGVECRSYLALVGEDNNMLRYGMATDDAPEIDESLLNRTSD